MPGPDAAAPAGFSALRVEAMGLATSLGSDLEAACAAARAGIIRTWQTEAFQVWNEHEGGVEGVHVHAAHPSTHGFVGQGRLIALLRGAWSDFARRAAAQASPGRAAIVLAFGDRARTTLGEALVAEEEARTAFRRAAATRDTAAENRRLGRALQEAMARLAGAGVAGIEVFPAGHCGFLEAVARGGQALAEGRAERVIVGAVDSLLDEVTLAWLLATDRLKHPAQPAGLMPGEAAVFALLAAASGGRAERRKPSPRIENLAFGREEHTLLDGHPGHGGGMSELLRQLVAASEAGGEALGWVLSDHNGETYRASDWGHALARLSGDFPALASARHWLPAQAFGDTGAASAGLALARVHQATARGYAPAAEVALVSGAEETLRSVAMLCAEQ